MAFITSRILSCIYRGTLISRPIFLKPAGNQVNIRQTTVTNTIRLLAYSTINNNVFFISCPSPTSNHQHQHQAYHSSTSNLQLLNPSSCVFSLFSTTRRNKSSKRDRKKGTKPQRNLIEADDEYEDEDGLEDEELESSKDFKDIKVKLSSLRMDVVLKAGLNLARNKVEAAFYESKIRVNGQKILKKSSQVYEGDEVDVELDEPATNPKFTYVSRVEVKRAGNYNPGEGKLVVILRRYPKLMVERPKNFTRRQRDDEE